MLGRSKKSSGVFQTFFPVLVLVSIGLAFAAGVLWQKVQYFEKGTVVPQASALPTTATQQPARTITSDQIKGLFGKDLIKFGDANKKLVFVEVLDPSCPYCHVASGKNPELNKQIGSQFTLVSDGGSYAAPVTEIKKLVDSGQASFVVIYFPGHGNGELGMEALYCAYDQGKYWQVHDLLMNNKGYELMNNQIKNDKTKTAQLVSFLGSAANSGELKTCIESGKYDQRLLAEKDLGLSLAADPNRFGTPHFLVNTTVFPGAYNFTDMKSVVDAALK